MFDSGEKSYRVFVRNVGNPRSREVHLESNLAKLSLEKAVQLFREWGFRVEAGPGHGEVTLILEGPDYRSYSVYAAGELPQIAAVALRVRRNQVEKKALQHVSHRYQAGGPYPAAQRMLN